MNNIKNKKQLSANVVAFRLVKKKLNKLTRRILGITSLFVLFSSFSLNSDPITSSEDVLTVANLRDMLEAEGVQHVDIVLRQAIQETGWFKCTSCSLSKNNIFGFYYKKKYLTYDNWQACVSYYKRWQDRHYKGGDYYVFLKKVGFATDPMYVKRLKALRVKG